MNLRRHATLIGAILAGLAVHLVSFFIQSHNPLGYDTGFYRRYLIEHIFFWQNVPGLGPDALVPKIMFDILKLTHLPVSVILYGSFLLIYVGITIALYKTLEVYANRKVALFAVLLFVLSPIQYFGYWYMLYKNALGILLIFLLALAIRKQSPWMYVCIAVIGFTHQTTSIIVLLSLAVFWLINKEARKQTTIMGLILAASYLALHAGSISYNLTFLPRGYFIEWFTYIVFSTPMAILAAIGARSFFKQHKGSFLFAFTIVSVLYPISHLPFYQRIFLYSDTGLILLAAYGALYLFNQARAASSETRKYFARILLILILVGMGAITANRVTHLAPIIEDSTIAEMELFDSTTPPGAYILTDIALAPWAEGWTHAHIIAPGMLLDTHNENEWKLFMSGTDEYKIAFLNTFPKPLYIFALPSEEERLLPERCAKHISRFVTQDVCE